MDKVTDKNTSEFRVYELTAEASDLRIPPGTVPKKLETTLGNTLPFYLIGATVNGFEYRQEFGNLRLTVFND